jgi:hypothetical protein
MGTQQVTSSDSVDGRRRDFYTIGSSTDLVLFSTDLLLLHLCRSQFWRIEISHLLQHKYSHLLVVQGYYKAAELIAVVCFGVAIVVVELQRVRLSVGRQS